MMKKNDIRKNMNDEEEEVRKEELSGYPEYPSDEDIYSKDKEESEINLEDISDEIEFPESELTYKRNSHHYESESDLDIPGSEENDLELTGGEDEENNYFSLGDEFDTDEETDEQ